MVCSLWYDIFSPLPLTATDVEPKPTLDPCRDRSRRQVGVLRTSISCPRFPPLWSSFLWAPVFPPDRTYPVNVLSSRFFITWWGAVFYYIKHGCGLFIYLLFCMQVSDAGRKEPYLGSQ